MKVEEESQKVMIDTKRTKRNGRSKGISKRFNKGQLFHCDLSEL